MLRTRALRSLVSLIALLQAPLLGCGAPPPPKPKPLGSGAPHAPKHHVVMISIDGLRPTMLGQAPTNGLRLPTLRALVDGGAHATGVIGTWPTVTYPAHTTLVTGVSPAQHGIATNHPFDPLGRNQDGWTWYARDIAVETLWDATTRAGMTSGASYWPVTVGARLTWNFPQFWRAKNDEDDKLLAALATPGLVEEARAKRFEIPAEHRSDHARADGAIFLLQEKKPALTLAYLTDLDTISHRFGPDSAEARSTLETIDGEVGRIVAAAHRAFGAEVTFVVVSDHGFAPIHATVQPNAMLANAGLLDVSAGAVTGYRAVSEAAGGSAFIVIDERATSDVGGRARALFDAAAKDPASGIAKVRSGDEARANGAAGRASLVLEAAPGFSFGNGVVGGPVVPSGDLGAHGYPPLREEMRACLVLAGDGVRAGVDLGVVAMTDVAPTVARLLGVELRAARGRVLDGALNEPGYRGDGARIGQASALK